GRHAGRGVVPTGECQRSDVQFFRHCQVRRAPSHDSDRQYLYSRSREHMVAHPVVLRGARTRVATARPTLLQRTDQDFITAILDDLSAGLQGLETIEQTMATTRDGSGVLKLYQPVQRTFTLAMVEVACELLHALAYPRLDPERIDSSGLVLRRLAAGENG